MASVLKTNARTRRGKKTTVSGTAKESSKQDIMATTTTTTVKKRTSGKLAPVRCTMQATFNNTIITFTDSAGGAPACSAGTAALRGSKKGTAYAAQVAAEKAGQTAKQQYGFAKADVFVKGVGMGRDAAIRALATLGIQVESIKDVTGVPHGGVRPKKARRV